MTDTNTDLTLHFKVFDNLSTAVLLLDRELTISLANQAAVALFGCNQSRLTQSTFTGLFQFHDFDLEHFRQSIIQSRSFSQSEAQVIFHDSRPALLEISCTPMQQHAIVEFKQIDQQKRISQENLLHHQHNAARELIRGLAHEIKNPLGGLRGAAQLLERSLDDDELKEFTSLIIEQSDRLRNLVDRLLGPNKPLNLQVTNIHRVLEQVRKLIDIEASDNLTIERDYDPSVPDIEIDEDLIEQVILNIVKNAQQALAKEVNGVITLTSRVMNQLTLNGQKYKLVLVIKIVDNGPGIPEEIKDTLFYPMVTSKSGGTGLGLAIAQTLIHQHNGRIDCESWPGHTEFTVLLPVTRN